MIHCFLRRILQKITLNTAGKIRQIIANPIQSNAVIAFPLASHPVYTPICPTRPHVPIPELTAGPFISKWKIQVAIGPVIAEERIGGIHVLGFLMIFGI